MKRLSSIILSLSLVLSQVCSFVSADELPAEEPIPAETLEEAVSESPPVESETEPEQEAQADEPAPEPESPEPELPAELEPVPEGKAFSIIISEILADPVENDAENEFIEIYNAGPEVVDLSGWRLDDA
ncbi:MAG: lamin tail domain-containing protein, partial [Patescibacteria group bacterium]